MEDVDSILLEDLPGSTFELSASDTEEQQTGGTSETQRSRAKAQPKARAVSDLLAAALASWVDIFGQDEHQKVPANGDAEPLPPPTRQLMNEQEELRHLRERAIAAHGHGLLSL